MNKKILLAICAAAAAGVAAPSAVAYRREEARLEASMRDVPQSERPLRVPSEKQMQAVFPGDSRRVLEESDKLALFSVSPTPGDYDELINSPPTLKFHDHRILGQTIRSGEAKAALLASFYDGLVLPRSKPSRESSFPANLKQIGLGCFNPRHGIRAVSGGKTVDLLICFECRKFEVYENGKLVQQKGLSTDAAQPYFNSVLTQARVPLSPN